MKKKQSPLEIMEEKVIDQVVREYQLGFDVANKKRKIFRDQDKLLNNVSDLDKIDLKTLYYIIENLMALYYSNEMKVEFKARRFGMEEQAENLNKLAVFDYHEMKKDLIDYEIQLNRFIRGVGIVANIDWDKNRKVPIWKVMDTRQRIPDPMGWFDPDECRFHGFETAMSIEELKSCSSYDQKQVDKLVTKEAPENALSKFEATTAANINYTEDNLEGDNSMREIYHHFTTFEGKKYLFTLGNERSVLLRAVEILPVNQEEKDNPSLIKFPVSTYYFSPQKYNPYGNSIMDLLQDKHRYKNILANLAFFREKDAALGDDVLFDSNLIKGSDITRPTINKKFIPVDGRRGNMGAAMMAIPKNATPSSTYNFEQFLDRNIEMTVGIDARQIGVAGDRSITATEAQMLQANNNLKAIFKNRINNIGERRFWQLWLRSYQENFKSSEKKIIRVTNSFGGQNYELSKKDFLTSEDPDIVIKSKSEVKAETEAKKRDLMPLLMNKTQDPNAPVVSRNIAERKLYELNGMDKDEIEAIIPYSYEELDALQKLELINMGIAEGAKIDNMNVDHNTYIVIFQRAMDNPVKFAAIEARKQAIIQMGLNQQQVGGNQTSRQLESQMINQAQNQTQNLNVESRGSVA